MQVHVGAPGGVNALRGGHPASLKKASVKPSKSAGRESVRLQ